MKNVFKKVSTGTKKVVCRTSSFVLGGVYTAGYLTMQSSVSIEAGIVSRLSDRTSHDVRIARRNHTQSQYLKMMTAKKKADQAIANAFKKAAKATTVNRDVYDAQGNVIPNQVIVQ